MRFGRRVFVAALPLMVGVGIGAATLTGCGGGGGDDQPLPIPFTRVEGGTRMVSGAPVTTWANVRADGLVQEVGVTLPLAVIQNPPAGPNPGMPFAVDIPFPAEVTSSTYFNFLSLDFNPQGHPPVGVYTVPHFDMHFYAVTPAQRNAILAPDPVAPAPERIPPGYSYPPPFAVAEATVPMMGVHASPNSDFAPGANFTATMIAGFYNGQMHFIEPMFTRELLLRRQSFTLPVPRPQVLGRATQYPTRFTANYDPSSDAYHVVFSDFVSYAR